MCCAVYSQRNQCNSHMRVATPKHSHNAQQLSRAATILSLQQQLSNHSNNNDENGKKHAVPRSLALAVIAPLACLLCVRKPFFFRLVNWMNKAPDLSLSHSSCLCSSFARPEENWFENHAQSDLCALNELSVAFSSVDTISYYFIDDGIMSCVCVRLN